MSSSLNDRIFKKSNLKILGTAGYSRESWRAERAEYTLILVFFIFLGLSILMIFLPKMLDTFGISEGVDTLVTVVAGLVSYDVFKEIISVEIGSIRKYENEQKEKAVEQAKLNIKRKYETQERNIRENRYYLTKVSRSAGIDIEKVPLNKFFHADLRDETVVLNDESFNSQIQIRTIRCKIQNVKDDLWYLLAFVASERVLAVEDTQLKKEPYCFLFLDLYAYLSAWLVCSIDNDQGRPMPIDAIGLNYENGSSLSLEIYQLALTIITKDLLEEPKIKSELGEPLKESIKERIQQLQRLLKDYYHDSKRAKS